MKSKLTTTSICRIAFCLSIMIGSQFIASNKSYAQEITIEAKFIVQDGRINKVDVSELLIKENAYLAVYTIKGVEGAHFACVRPESNTQSYGNIFNLVEETSEATDKNYKIETYKFKWSYVNSYDTKKGTANVILTKITKDVGIAFECKVIPENLDVAVYKGYMEGSLQSLEN